MGGRWGKRGFPRKSRALGGAVCWTMGGGEGVPGRGMAHSISEEGSSVIMGSGQIWDWGGGPGTGREGE